MGKSHVSRKNKPLEKGIICTGLIFLPSEYKNIDFIFLASTYLPTWSTLFSDINKKKMEEPPLASR